ncbi:V-type ATP synthase subunit E family protein [Peptostreptococcaceae bacterium AGR-M142]
MPSIENKIDFFDRVINENLNTEFQEEMNKLKEEEQNVLVQKEKEFKREQLKEINKMKRKGEQERNALISKARIERKRDLFKLRERFIKDITEEIKIHIEDFCKNEEYADFLFKKIKEGIALIENCSKFIIECSSRDKDIVNQFIKELKEEGIEIEIRISKDEILGGCFIYSFDNLYMIDISIDDMIENLKDEIGAYIMDTVLVGDLDE